MSTEFLTRHREPWKIETVSASSISVQEAYYVFIYTSAFIGGVLDIHNKGAIAFSCYILLLHQDCCEHVGKYGANSVHTMLDRTIALIDGRVTVTDTTDIEGAVGEYLIF